MPRQPISDPANADPLARVSYAFSHPLRVRVVRALVAGPGSASTLSQVIDDASKENLSYHLRVLDLCGVVDLARVRPVRGAKEKIFELRTPARWGDVWEPLPPVAVAGYRHAFLGEFVALATAALDLQATEPSPGTVFDGSPLKTDEQGFMEISELLHKALADAAQIAEKSQDRLDESSAGEGINVVIGTAAFQAPPAGWWEARSGDEAQAQ